MKTQKQCRDKISRLGLILRVLKEKEAFSSHVVVQKPGDQTHQAGPVIKMKQNQAFFALQIASTLKAFKPPLSHGFFFLSEKIL